MPNPFDGNDGAWPGPWPQYSPSNLPYSSAFPSGGYYGDSTLPDDVVKSAYDFWFGRAPGGPTANALPDTSAGSSAAAYPSPYGAATPGSGAPPFSSWTDPYLNSSVSSYFPRPVGTSSAPIPDSLGLTPPPLPDPNNPYSLPLPPQRLPYSAAAGGM